MLAHGLLQKLPATVKTDFNNTLAHREMVTAQELFLQKRARNKAVAVKQELPQKVDPQARFRSHVGTIGGSAPSACLCGRGHSCLFRCPEFKG